MGGGVKKTILKKRNATFNHNNTSLLAQGNATKQVKII
jgi:hypothetical protein